MTSKTDKTIAQDARNQPDPLDQNQFIGTQALIEKQAEQLTEFEAWFKNNDWLAFHHHHYDWWMFPIDEVSSRGKTFQLTQDALIELRHDQRFIGNLRRGVFLLAYSWGWDITNRKLLQNTGNKQDWAYWPVRLYKAGRCMFLFGQYDYYDSLKTYAIYVKETKKERLDFFSHEANAKVDVLDRWSKMEGRM